MFFPCQNQRTKRARSALLVSLRSNTPLAVASVLTAGLIQSAPEAALTLPTYLPYQTQHLILNTAQRVLEECCFEFAMSTIPSLLCEMEWDCPVVVDLAQWVKILWKENGTLYHHIDPGAEETKNILTSVSNLRYTAVHRPLKSAVEFAQILQDGWRAAQLEELRGEVDSQIKAMEMNKNLLEDIVSLDIREM